MKEAVITNMIICHAHTIVAGNGMMAILPAPAHIHSGADSIAIVALLTLVRSILLQTVTEMPRAINALRMRLMLMTIGVARIPSQDASQIVKAIGRVARTSR